MPTKFGRVARYGRTTPKFVEALLDTGERVELSREAFGVVQNHERA